MWPCLRLLLAFALTALVGCQSKSNSTPVAKNGHSDTLVVLASRLWASNTYQDFLSPIIASHQRTIEWIDASELNAIQLVSSLERVDGVLLTGGADIHPAWYHQPQDTIVCGTIEPSRDSFGIVPFELVGSKPYPLFGHLSRNAIHECARRRLPLPASP